MTFAFLVGAPDDLLCFELVFVQYSGQNCKRSSKHIRSAMVSLMEPTLCVTGLSHATQLIKQL